MTPLFPKDGEAITIQQGNTGDCYLLTAIDCILNSGTEGLPLVKSLFTQTAEGVALRIKRTDIFDSSNNITPGKLDGKYTYHYDAATNEDVFFLPNKRLQEIDESDAGVRSNALAIKILERVSSYYYTGYWPNEDMNASVAAHNIPSRHKDSSTVFVGKFLGVEAQDSSDIEAIIKLKTEKPNQPVYISMAYGYKDYLGRIHGRHALRIDKIVPKQPDGYDFVLINPWNNQKKETFSIDEIKARNYRFSIYNVKKQEPKNDLISTPDNDLDVALNALSDPFVLQNPPLLHLLRQLKQPFLYTEENIQAVSALYKTTPYLIAQFNLLAEGEKSLFNECLLQAKGNKKDFIAALFRAIPRYSLIRLVYQQETELDFKHIGSVVLDLIANDKNQILKTQLNKKEFFDLMMRVTHQDKMRDASCSAAEATRLLDSGLVNYYFSSKGFLSEIYLSRSGHQRFFFTGFVFSLSSIREYWDEKTLYAKAVATLFYKSSNAQELLDAVKIMDLHWVDQQFLDTVLATTVYENPTDLLTKADSLSALNPALAKELHALIVARFNLIDTPKEEAQEQKPGQLVEESNEQQRKSLAHGIIVSYLDKIRDKVISFSTVTIPEITAESARLIAELNKLVDNEELHNARQLLSDTDIATALTNKKRDIGNAAANQIQECMLARAVITRHLRKISEIKISFYAVTDSEIDIEAQRMLDEINALVNNQELINARHLLSDKQIERAIIDQKYEIEQTANERKQTVKAAHSVIKACVAQIGRLAVSFAGSDTLDGVNKKQGVLLGELNLLQNRSYVIHAQRVLGRASQSLQDAAEAKRLSIAHAAQLAREQIQFRARRSAEEFLLKIDFTGQMNKILSMKARLQQNGQENAKYELAAEKAQELCDALLEAKRLFLISDLPEKQRLITFRDKSLTAINTVLPVLAEHRGWKEFLADLANVIIAVCSVCLVNLIAGRFRLFQPQTDSAIVVNEFADTFKAIDVGA
ncbi:hypothetical protein [Legionella shakespearei]|uniref:Ninein n=1 Tax=Legionella shakespearei DSM 23087 TaxID=1122169 RepID=A0A0W0Z5T7_9GAMM|nr:hypothetical protein [Legionella shakespearei]KTD64147.1 ninein [Legionella shakespearei DSM 23087]